MDLFAELLSKLPKLFSRDKDSGPTSADEWLELENTQALKLSKYYSMWQRHIKNAATNNQMISNGWAFSTLSGLAYFESHIRSDQEFGSIYRNRPGEIENTIDAIAKQAGTRRFGGAIIYGYGNLLRETQFIETALVSKMLNNERIYLIDCSLFYHLFALSAINPLRQHVPAKRIKPRLMDYFANEKSRDELKYVRDDLNPTKPVIHLFLGNTFCNVDPGALQSVLDAAVRVGDFVIAEYAVYDNLFFKSTDDDYVSHMARRAAAEMFSIPEDAVTVRNLPDGSSTNKITEIKLRDLEGTELVFKSMLRRRFLSTELTNGVYSLMSSEKMLGGKIHLDSYTRLPNLVR